MILTCMTADRRIRSHFGSDKAELASASAQPRSNINKKILTHIHNYFYNYCGIYPIYSYKTWD